MSLIVANAPKSNSTDDTVTTDAGYATFYALSPATAIALNKSMLSIVNDGSSDIHVKIRALYIVNSQTASLTGVAAEFRLHRITGHSVGTSLTPLSADSADSLVANVTARTNSTVAGEAAAYYHRWLWSSDEWGPGTADTESGDHASQTGMNLLGRPNGCKAFTLRAGEGVSVKHVTNSTNGTFDVLMIFTTETP